jgi:aminoglycoside/choline kinase family phosphotransferase
MAPRLAPVWRPEQVSAPWLTAVLLGGGALGQASVVDYDLQPVGTGQMADTFRIVLDYDAAAPEAPATVVAKFTAANETSLSTALAMRTSEVEVRFYQEVAATIGARTPHCFFSDVDPSSAEFVLVLEDLAPAEPGDQLEGCHPDRAALALAELAALHAPRWDDAGLGRLAWLTRGADDVTTGEQLLPVLFSGFVERYGDFLDDNEIGVGERLMAKIGWYLRSRPGPRTVQHADYRLDNLLFGTDGGGPLVGIVDWQTVTLGPGAADVSYFVGAGLTPGDRRAHEDELLRDYHGRLCSAGVTGYPWGQFFTDYRRYAYAGYLMAVGASMMVERTRRGDEMFLAMVRRHAAQIDDLASESLLGSD